VALRLVVSGFNIELAAVMSGIEVDAVEAAGADAWPTLSERGDAGSGLLPVSPQTR